MGFVETSWHVSAIGTRERKNDGRKARRHSSRDAMLASRRLKYDGTKERGHEGVKERGENEKGRKRELCRDMPWHVSAVSTKLINVEQPEIWEDYDCTTERKNEGATARQNEGAKKRKLGRRS